MVSNPDMWEPSQTKLYFLEEYIWKTSLVENSATSINLTAVGKPAAGGTEAACLSLDDAYKSASPSALIKVAAFCLHVCAARAHAVISYVGASTNTSPHVYETISCLVCVFVSRSLLCR